MKNCLREILFWGQSLYGYTLLHEKLLYYKFVEVGVDFAEVILDKKEVEDQSTPWLGLEE